MQRSDRRRGLFVLAAIALAAGCTSVDKGSGAAQTPVRIGVPLTLSGPVKSYGEDNRKGLALALEHINAAGGINGRKVELDIKDDGGEGTLALDQVRTFTRDTTVLAIVGATRTNVAQEIAKFTPAQGVPFISVGSTGVWQGDFPAGVYRSTRTDKQLVGPLLRFAHDSLGVRKIALISATDDAWSASLIPLYDAEAARLGISISVVVSENKGELDASAKLQRVVADRPDAVVINLPAPLALPIANRLTKLGLAKQLLLGTAAFSTPATWQLADSGVLSRVVLAENYYPSSLRPATRAFADAYRKKYHEEAPPYAAYAYDGLRLLASACARLKPACARAGLMNEFGRTQGYEGVLGTLSYSGSGDAVKPIYVLRIEGRGYRLAAQLGGNAPPTP